MGEFVNYWMAGSAALHTVLPFAIPLLALMIPIIVVLTNHQRKMAELIHKGQNEPNVNAALLHELQSLRAEVSQLKESVNIQALALDDLKPGERSTLQQRVGDSDV